MTPLNSIINLSDLLIEDKQSEINESQDISIAKKDQNARSLELLKIVN
jgi:hypothetical protein